MPSKYSHSVVLAQHSSRGLINLPNEQYVDYLKSSPLLTTEAPLRPTTASSKPRSRAISTKTYGSERLAAEKTFRQQSSLDRLAAGAHQHQAGNRRFRGAPRRIILDSEDEDDDEALEPGMQPEDSRPSHQASAYTAQTLKQKRLPQRLPIEIHQQVVQNGVFSPTFKGPRPEQKKGPPRPLPAPKPEVRSSFDLPIQQPRVMEETLLSKSVPLAQVHSREISIPKSLATPQLSPTGTETTHPGESPATPFSSLARGATPAMAEERGSLSRDNSDVSQNTQIWKPAATRMPSQANFDGFLDGDDDTYFKDVPEPPGTQQSRLTETNHLPPRTDSFSSLSSLGDFGVPSVSQTTGKPKTSAAAMADSPITAHQFLVEAAASPPRFSSLPPSQSQSRLSGSAIRRRSKLLPPAIEPDLDLDLSIPTRSFDDRLLDSAAAAAPQTLLQFLGSLESRFEDTDSNSGDAAAPPPPDIARRPPSAMRIDGLGDLVIDSRGDLVIDSRGGVSNVLVAAQKDGERKGLWRSLRIKGMRR
jgi:hypothetical protein